MSEKTLIDDQEDLREEEKVRNQKIKSLEAKIADLLNRLDPTRITWKLIEKKLESSEVTSLESRATDLRRQAAELSAKVTPMDIHEAKLRKFIRDGDDLLAAGKREEMSAIEREKDIYLEDRKKLLSDIQNLNGQIEGVEGQRKALLTSTFKEAFDEIKRGLASKLSGAVIWAEKELAEFTQLQGDLGIKLFFNVESELRLFREGPWRETRDKLDKWLP
jgi:predicted  nucleic acid-binding Zn-ribbon protein